VTLGFRRASPGSLGLGVGGLWSVFMCEHWETVESNVTRACRADSRVLWVIRD
jgi:hypothetical protein